MFSVRHTPFITLYPSWLLSPTGSGWEDCLSCSEDASVAEPKPPRHSHVLAPQPLKPISILQRVTVKGDAALNRQLSNIHALRPSPTHSDDSWSSHSSSTAASIPAASPSPDQGISLPMSAPITSSGRVRLPVQFSDDQIEHTVTFASRYGESVSLAEWARLSEKRKTHLGLACPHERLDELFPDDAKVLFQCHWPGYATRTRFLDLPSDINDIGSNFTTVNLLDMVCKELLNWILRLTNDRHITCRDPRWAIGLNQITFKHIYVSGVVRTKGYVAKWVPVLEIDSTALSMAA